ncbi:hypothetical protein LCGC14_0816670 [marine sediment metagenome]|uniref:Uncharacterized protein n=1 Tax=marine sediment metagenome TaxID=412755 RepID=A0A0F9PJZ2_9ZZZZ
MRPLFERYGISEARPLADGGIAGIALPFNVSDQRPGAAFMDDGTLRFFAYKVYDPGMFDTQLAQTDYGGRVQFQWTHGGRSPENMTGEALAQIPIGRVTQLQATPTLLMFQAVFNSTSLAQEIQKAVSSNDLREVSAGVWIDEFEFDVDSEGNDFVRITEGRVRDISVVDLAQFTETRILEHLSHQEHHALPSGVEVAPGVSPTEALRGVLQTYSQGADLPVTPFGTPAQSSQTRAIVQPPRRTTTTTGRDDAKDITVLRADWGALWAAYNDLATENRLLHGQVETEALRKGGS